MLFCELKKEIIVLSIDPFNKLLIISLQTDTHQMTLMVFVVNDLDLINELFHLPINTSTNIKLTIHTFSFLNNEMFSFVVIDLNHPLPSALFSLLLTLFCAFVQITRKLYQIIK